MRLPTAQQVRDCVTYRWITNEVILFDVQGHARVSAECADEIVLIFNATTSLRTVNLYHVGAQPGVWQICVHEQTAGTDVLGTVTNGQVSVAPLSALVLVRGVVKE